MSDQPWEYVPEIADVHVAGLRDVDDPIRASVLVIDALSARIEAITTARPSPGIMLSGGVDSLLVAAVARELGLAPSAVTVAAEETSEDVPPSIEAARALGIDHEIALLDPDRLAALCRDCIHCLGTDEVWEVLGGVSVVAGFSAMDSLGVTGPILTGGGADVLFGGGAPRPASEAEFTEMVSEQVAARFIRELPIPDFYDRLPGVDPERYFKVFQTEAIWRMSLRLSVGSLWTGPWDKAALRHAAVRLGVPEELAWTAKSPLQRSSGLMAGLSGSVRRAMARYPDAGRYADPMTEDAEATLARLALRYPDDLLG